MEVFFVFPKGQKVLTKNETRESNITDDRAKACVQYLEMQVDRKIFLSKKLTTIPSDLNLLFLVQTSKKLQENLHFLELTPNYTARRAECMV